MRTHLFLGSCLLVLTVALVPDPGRAAPYSRGDSSWYIGFGIGGGGGWIYIDGDSSPRQGGGAAMFKVGGTIGPHLLIGFEASAWDYGRGDGLIQFTHNDAVLTWFPWANAGFYLKGGAGLGWAAIGFGDVWGRSRAGFDIKLGLGYELQLGESFNLGIEAAFANTIYEDDKTGDSELFLTFSWY